jgi:hypothetical protein
LKEDSDVSLLEPRRTVWALTGGVVRSSQLDPKSDVPSVSMPPWLVPVQPSLPAVPLAVVAVVEFDTLRRACRLSSCEGARRTSIGCAGETLMCIGLYIGLD